MRPFHTHTFLSWWRLLTQTVLLLWPLKLCSLLPMTIMCVTFSISSTSSSVQALNHWFTFCHWISSSVVFWTLWAPIEVEQKVNFHLVLPAKSVFLFTKCFLVHQYMCCCWCLRLSNFNTFGWFNLQKSLIFYQIITCLWCCRLVRIMTALKVSRALKNSPVSSFVMMHFTAYGGLFYSNRSIFLSLQRITFAGIVAAAQTHRVYTIV